jgi:hypothetical protein
MKKGAPLVLLAVCAMCPASSAAQVLGLGARAGTLGFGGEAALALSDRLVVRGGMGLMPFDVGATFNDIDVTLKLPTWYNVGVDLYLNGAVRLGGGVLFKSQDPELTGKFDSTQEIGGVPFTPGEIGTLTGVIDSSDPAPYALIGFGNHTAPGLGLFLDLGVAFLGDPEVSLYSTGGILSDDPATQEALDREAQSFEDDMRAYLRFWPILSLGLRIGLG